MFGDRIDRLGAACPVLVAAVRFAAQPAKRLILTPVPDMGSSAYRVDLQVSQEIVKRLQKSKNLPLQVLLPEGRTVDGLDLSEKVEIVPVKPGLENVRAHAQPGDMLIIPIAVLQRWIGFAALEFGEAGRSVTLVITVSPCRLNLTAASAGKKTESILNLGATN